ncbi:membrane cofactor protein-like isoform X3 [Poecilia latipinna]|uniref:membrane cofactor protein-like isoform X3 n=1 Tax=Poecilia latipinna TaxID=48699 RepID=UPI00072EE892|nr:PREDICTED: membrane cofactor protein-like isoform X3 [Poecilia latipinna]
MGITAVFILCSLGFAIIAQAQDCSRPLAGDHMNLRDDYITQQTFPDGSKVSFVCDHGYTSAGGSASITCTAGTWSTVRLRCERKSCGTLGEVSHGEVNYDGNEFGDTATVTCHPGYMLVGRSSFRCEVNGWSGRLPTCDAVQCTTPEPVANGTFYPQKDFYNFGEVARYSCYKGFVLNGPTETACSDDGEFSPSPPTCVKVHCEDPVIENAVYESGSRPPHKHKATVTYRCKPGYIMYGSPTMICDINNQWSPSLPECKRATTPSVTTATPTTTTKKPKGRTSTQSPTSVFRGVTSTQAPTSNSPGNGDKTPPTLIIIAVVICIILIIGIIIFCILKKRERHSSVGPKLLHVKILPCGEDYPRTTE